jgi:2-hydroxychromene-2-carboxylate isomerase
MSAKVDFYFDVVCPYAYLAHTQVERVCAGAELVWKPILLGGLFRVIGAGDGPMPGMPATKARLNLLDMHRWAARDNVPLNMPNAHPRRTVLAMRAILASGDVPRAAKELFRRYWRDGLDVSNPDVVADALDSAGFDGRAVVDRAEDPEIKRALRDAVDEAAAAGAFGVPTFVVHRPGADPELIWGQDRLHFVTAAIEGRLGAA